MIHHLSWIHSLFQEKCWAVVGLPDEHDGISKDHEFLYIHEYVFDRIMAMHQNEGISPKIIVIDISLFINKDSQNKRYKKTKKTNYIMKTRHTLHINRKKTVVIIPMIHWMISSLLLFFNLQLWPVVKRGYFNLFGANFSITKCWNHFQTTFE